MEEEEEEKMMKTTDRLVPDGSDNKCLMVEKKQNCTNVPKESPNDQREELMKNGGKTDEVVTKSSQSGHQIVNKYTSNGHQVVTK